MVPSAFGNLQVGPILERVAKTTQQSNVGEQIKSNKDHLHITRRVWNSNVEVHERSHIGGVSLPPMHLAKALASKIGNMRGS